jgi:hypothetical protein
MDICLDFFGVANNIYVPGVSWLIIVIRGLWCSAVFLYNQTSKVEPGKVKLLKRFKVLAKPVYEHDSRGAHRLTRGTLPCLS